jgi:hypothetical protein
MFIGVLSNLQTLFSFRYSLLPYFIFLLFLFLWPRFIYRPISSPLLLLVIHFHSSILALSTLHFPFPCFPCFIFLCSPSLHLRSMFIPLFSTSSTSYHLYSCVLLCFIVPPFAFLISNLLSLPSNSIFRFSHSVTPFSILCRSFLSHLCVATRAFSAAAE